MNTSHILLTALALQCGLLPGALAQDDDQVLLNGIQYQLDLDDETCSVAPLREADGQSAYQGQLSVPPQITVKGVSYEVRKVGDFAFTSYDAGPNTRLTAVTLPETVREIGQAAFQLCIALERVAIPEGGLETIGGNAFAGCIKLAAFNLPASVANILGNPWNRCTGLQHISVTPGSQTYRAMQGVLMSADGRQIIACATSRSGSYAVPGGVTEISMQAFGGCKGLTSVLLPAGLQSIGVGAFQGCTGLTKMSLPAGLQVIGEGAFQGCTALESVTLPASLTALGSNEYADNGVFEDCHALQGLNIPAAVAHIDPGVVGNCSSLKAITIEAANKSYKLDNGALVNTAGTLLLAYVPATEGEYAVPITVAEIGAKAFAGCDKLTAVTIKNAATALGPQAFANCPKLKNITFLGEEYKTSQGILYNAPDGNRLVCYPAGKEGTFAPPATVNEIEAGAFKGAAVTSVTIPEGVEELDYQTFADCAKLATVSLPKSLVKVHYTAFEGCQALQEVLVSAGAPAELVARIEKLVPAGCKVTKK